MNVSLIDNIYDLVDRCLWEDGGDGDAIVLLNEKDRFDEMVKKVEEIRSWKKGMPNGDGCTVNFYGGGGEENLCITMDPRVFDDKTTWTTCRIEIGPRATLANKRIEKKKKERKQNAKL